MRIVATKLSVKRWPLAAAFFEDFDFCPPRIYYIRGMLIANPIYDVAFKRLLENNHVAMFLVGTILGCKVITLEHKPQEHTKFNDVGRPTLYRMDFSATIEVEGEGQKTVIIEVQKAKNLDDVYRFRE